MNKNLEHRSLHISAVGALIMAILGVYYGIKTSSEAILLDGLFSVTSFFIAILTLKAVKLISEPESPSYHYGLSTLEPFVNMSKGLIMLIICICAAVSACFSIYNGGNTYNGAEAINYAFIASAFVFGVFFYLNKTSKLVDSPILKAESSNWLIDGVISAAVGIAFIGGTLLKTMFEYESPYLDSIIVLVLVSLILHIPINLIKKNFHEVLLGAPSKRDQKEIMELVEKETKALDTNNFVYKITQCGRNTFATINIFMNKDYKLSTLEDIREKKFLRKPKLILTLI